MQPILPSDVLTTVFTYVATSVNPIQNIYSVSRVSKQWRQLSSNVAIWNEVWIRFSPQIEYFPKVSEIDHITDCLEQVHLTTTPFRCSIFKELRWLRSSIKKLGRTSLTLSLLKMKPLKLASELMSCCEFTILAMLKHNKYQDVLRLIKTCPKGFNQQIVGDAILACFYHIFSSPDAPEIMSISEDERYWLFGCATYVLKKFSQYITKEFTEFFPDFYFNICTELAKTYKFQWNISILDLQRSGLTIKPVTFIIDDDQEDSIALLPFQIFYHLCLPVNSYFLFDVEAIEKAIEMPLQSHALSYEEFCVLFEKILEIPQIDINGRDKQGNTALHYAKRFGFKKIADILSESGNADQNMQNNQGITARQIPMSTLPWTAEQIQNCIGRVFTPDGYL